MIFPSSYCLCFFFWEILTELEKSDSFYFPFPLPHKKKIISEQDHTVLLTTYKISI